MKVRYDIIRACQITSVVLIEKDGKPKYKSTEHAQKTNGQSHERREGGVTKIPVGKKGGRGGKKLLTRIKVRLLGEDRVGGGVNGYRAVVAFTAV